MAISEEYLIKFKGDNSQLKQKLNETGAATDSLKTKIGGVGKSFGGLAAALSVGLIVGKFKSIANEMDKINESAGRLGIATEQLSALSYAAKLSGLEFGGLETAIRKMQISMTNASEGSISFQEAFARAGLTIQDLQGLNVEEQFIKIAGAVGSIDDPAQRTATAMEIFGRSGLGVVDMAKDGEAGIKALTDEARKMGVVFDAEAGEKAAKLNDDLDRLSASVNGVFMKMAEKGAFDVMIGGINALSEVIIFATTKYGDLLRVFGVEFNAQDTINNLTESMQDDLEAANNRLARLQSDGISGFFANAHLTEAEIATQTAKTIAEINRIEGVIKNLQENYGENAKKPEPASNLPEYLPRGYSGGDFSGSKTPIADSIKPDLDKVAKDIDDAIKPTKLESDITDAFSNAFDNISVLSGDFKTDMNNLFLKLGADIAKAALSPLGEQLGNSLGSLFSGGGGGGGLFSSIGSLFSFDGGGFTGSGTRSGGLDGKGGMLSLVHPNETVLDHTKGQSMGGSGGVSVNQYNNNTFTSDTDIDRRIKAHLPIMMDTTKRAVLQALQSGGEYSKVNGSRL